MRFKIKDLFKVVLSENGLRLLGWRKTPTNNQVLGRLARDVEPELEHVFIGAGSEIRDNAHFERKLFVVRKVIENAVRKSSIKQRGYFYICSLSSRTVVFKGLMLADQITEYMPDLHDSDMQSGMAIVHQRYSTNTFPSWDLAQPFRYLCHNGEINTLRGNLNWMAAREAIFSSPLFGNDISKIRPVCTPGASDTANLDNVVELLYHTGRSLPHAMMMLIPEAWQMHQEMSEEKKAFYEYHSCMMEPWDGPASIPFTDGECIGAMLDRNGLRPSRYTVTKDDFVVMASESGVIEIEPENILYRGVCCREGCSLWT